MHARWQEMLPYYLNGTLPPADRLALEDHLAGCPACRHELEEWALIGGVVREEMRGWVGAPPAIAPETRAQIALAIPASANGRHSGAGYPYPRPQAQPAPRRRLHIPLTLAATLAVAAAVVLLLGIWLGGRDTLPPTPTLAQGGVLPVTPEALATRMPPSATPWAVVTATPVHDLGILATEVVPVTPTPSATTTPRRPPPMWTPPTITQTPVMPTPTAVFGHLIGFGYDLVTTTQVGPIPAGERVRISHAYFTGAAWIYGIVTYDNTTTAEASADQLRIDRFSTPTAVFDRALRQGTWLQTLELVGDIPAGTPVRIGSALYDGSRWVYTVYTEAGLDATAYEWQLAPIPTATPLPVTPTMTFSGLIGGPYRFTLRASVGPITPQDFVRLVQARYDAGAGEWVYSVVTQDGRGAEVPLHLLVYPPPSATPAPSLTATPTATPTPSAQP